MILSTFLPCDCKVRMLGQTLQDNLTEHVQSFFSRLAKDFTVEVTKLADVWNRAPAPKVPAGQQVTVKTKADPNGPKCVYVYQKGKNPGKTCGSACTAGSSSYCKKHLKYDSSAPSAAPPGPTGDGTESKTAVKFKPTATQMTISKNDFGNYEHRATNLVFNSDKKVYGKQVEEKVVGLNASDVENCKRYGFSYLPTAVVVESPTPTADEKEVVDEDMIDDMAAVENVEDEDVE